MVKEHPEGWDFFVNPLIEACLAHDVKVLQTKQKFGTLRFYTRGEKPDWLQDMIQAAERISGMVCEEYGTSGRLRDVGYGYIRTLSDEAFEAVTAERK